MFVSDLKVMRITRLSTLLLLTTCLLHLVVAKYCDDKEGNARKCEDGTCCTSDETGCCKIGASLWYTWLLIVIFAIFVCVCIGCCRKCYCKQERRRDMAITVESNARSVEYVEQLSSSSSYSKRRIDAPPSYFDVTPNFIEDEDLPPPYPGENNT